MGQSHQPSLRLFIAVLAPPSVRSLVEQVQAELRREDLPVRWIDPAGAHITLQFLGATPRTQVPDLMKILAEVASRLAALHLRTDRLGAFPNPSRPRVLWLGLNGELDRLRTLQAAVVAATSTLGFVAEERPFRPHLTLGRVRDTSGGQDQARIGQALARVAAPPVRDWPVEEIALMMSTLSRAGATYQALERWPLTGGQ